MSVHVGWKVASQAKCAETWDGNIRHGETAASRGGSRGRAGRYTAAVNPGMAVDRENRGTGAGTRMLRYQRSGDPLAVLDGRGSVGIVGVDRNGRKRSVGSACARPVPVSDALRKSGCAVAAAASGSGGGAGVGLLPVKAPSETTGGRCFVGGSVLPAVLPAVSGTASRFLTRGDPLRCSINPIISVFCGVIGDDRNGLRISCSTN